MIPLAPQIKYYWSKTWKTTHCKTVWWLTSVGSCRWRLNSAIVAPFGSRLKCLIVYHFCLLYKILKYIYSIFLFFFKYSPTKVAAYICPFITTIYALYLKYYYWYNFVMQCWPWQNGELALAELSLKGTRGVVEVGQTFSYSGDGDDYDDAGGDNDGCGVGDD